MHLSSNKLAIVLKFKLWHVYCIGFSHTLFFFILVDTQSWCSTPVCFVMPANCNLMYMEGEI